MDNYPEFLIWKDGLWRIVTGGLSNPEEGERGRRGEWEKELFNPYIKISLFGEQKSLNRQPGPEPLGSFYFKTVCLRD